MTRHNYHLVTESPWPLLCSMNSLSVPVAAVMYFHNYSNAGVLLLVSLVILGVSMGIWWRDVVREGTFIGDHTLVVQKGLRYGMILFIVSEVMFFFAFFLSFL
jgi:cytochrome c oxidase subunit 3